MMAEGFLNPYTFVPAFPRDELPEPLRDGPPPSRDLLHQERWSGRIHVRLTVATPLLLLDPNRTHSPSEGADGHEVYPVRVREGRPYLAPTAVKGMLRSAFEAVTNSRFGVFDGHQEPLAFRRDAGFAPGLVPVRVAGDGVLEQYRAVPLEMYDKHGKLLPGRSLRHMQQIRAVIVRKDKGRTEAMEVRVPKSAKKFEGKRVVEGFAYVTGPTIEKKRFERFFYGDPEQRAPLKLARDWQDIVDDWDRLIDSYKNAHSNEELYQRPTGNGRVAAPGERIGEGPGQLAWSPHIYDPAHQALRSGTLCYARLNKERKVERLYPVLVPRDVYAVAPAELLHSSLRPASCYTKMSPADRLFGWVAPAGRNMRPSSYRGRLRIGPATCADDAGTAIRRFSADGLPLAVLGTPKPQQGRFYVARSATHPDKPVEDRIAKAEIYRPGRGLRGRKVYWHHAGLDAQRHWQLPAGGSDPTQVLVAGRYREYLRPRALANESAPLARNKAHFDTGDAEQRDSQNRSIEGWVVPGTTFEFAIDVHDVDECELGALAWLLNLPAGHFQRLGFGRPLGFGSVRLDVEHAELHKGADYSAYYRTLSGNLPESDWRSIIDAARKTFDAIVESSPALKIIRQDILATTRGVSHLPVHYPRVREESLGKAIPMPPDPRGLQYKWFTANEQPSGKSIMYGRGRSLPRPTGDQPPLEVYISDDKGADPAGSTRGRNRQQSGNFRQGRERRRGNR
ncbi:TIGR03986 family CRISPR-associated RAMP protein [Nonomuraea sp. FMUSA5-5]|uniref:TIGR03986 family CRISPR-associated RAMP protein n=1 Tax=Nonomuraea composti TaxID=2720023 RepID=A0ABX1BNJ9_9ACTN|nr:TIGR03986 family CRISPR-associated RAMP protein [Nonomuraea sp. FMUSA5-5]NJP97985.1 TIGR03986 family CRISPR-associated RAMP protein [Nonomuraea sp. FMUSA5-5]